MLIVLYLLLILILPLAFSVGVSYRTLPEGKTCPLCGGETLRLVSSWLGLTSRVLRATILHRRWCPRCGWEGVTRIPLERAAPSELGVDPASADAVPEAEPSALPAAIEEPPALAVEIDVDAADGDADAAADAAGTDDTIELRKLVLNGQPWRVLLQFWSDRDRWCGRLIFLAPSGRLCPDPREPFRGDSPLDVLGQALALSDRILTYRLREVTSD